MRKYRWMRQQSRNRATNLAFEYWEQQEREFSLNAPFEMNTMIARNSQLTHAWTLRYSVEASKLWMIDSMNGRWS